MMGLAGRLVSVATHKIHTLPILILMPHSRCNCRCVMCDIWKANLEKKEISAETLSEHIGTFRKLGVQRVVLSGGEALMHSNLWKLCEQLKSIGVKISLLSTGLSLKANAAEVIEYCDNVIVSLDGSLEVHNSIRNIPTAYKKLEEGVTALKSLDPEFRVTGRCVVQKLNFRDFSNVIRSARALGLDQISFLAADVSSKAFNHSLGWEEEKRREVALTSREAEEFEKIILQSFIDFNLEYRNKFIAEGQEKILALAQYYRAMNDQAKFAPRKCNAPWVSAVIESTGDVMPCFFHKAYGNIYQASFEEIINSKEAKSFRKKLDVQKDATCQKCVCSLYRSPWRAEV